MRILHYFFKFALKSRYFSPKMKLVYYNPAFFALFKRIVSQHACKNCITILFETAHNNVVRVAATAGAITSVLIFTSEHCHGDRRPQIFDKN